MDKLETQKVQQQIEPDANLDLMDFISKSDFSTVK